MSATIVFITCIAAAVALLIVAAFLPHATVTSMADLHSAAFTLLGVSAGSAGISPPRFVRGQDKGGPNGG